MTSKEPSGTADRRALEHILGFRVAGEPWPSEALPYGTRVRVVRDVEWDGPWAREFFGTIDDVRAPLSLPGES